MAKITNVLSLFDGLSCGQIALKELGIIPEKYYVPEGYTDCLSFLEASNVLGDGWTVEVIKHIMQWLKF